MTEEEYAKAYAKGYADACKEMKDFCKKCKDKGDKSNSEK